MGRTMLTLESDGRARSDSFGAYFYTMRRGVFLDRLEFIVLTTTANKSFVLGVKNTASRTPFTSHSRTRIVFPSSGSQELYLIPAGCGRLADDILIRGRNLMFNLRYSLQ